MPSDDKVLHDELPQVDLFLEDVVTRHQLMVMRAAEFFLKEEMVRRKVYAVLLMWITQDFHPGIDDHNGFCIASLVLFHDLMNQLITLGGEGQCKGSHRILREVEMKRTNDYYKTTFQAINPHILMQSFVEDFG